MATRNKTEYIISNHFACALEYGDYGDMTHEEIIEMGDWMHNEQDGKAGHWSVDDCEHDNYARCEVTGLFSSCMKVSWNYKA